MRRGGASVQSDRKPEEGVVAEMSVKSWIKILGLFALALFVIAEPMPAQTIVTGAITGTVHDPSGAVIAGATVNLKNVETGATQTATAGSNGQFHFTLLKPGNYQIEASQTGFKTTKQTVLVNVGQTTTTSLQLQVGAGATTVEVSGAAPVLQTQDANISSNFDTKTVQNIPNPGNDLTYVAQTAPGVEMNTSSMNGYGNFSAFGLPGTANLFTVNGNDNNDAFLNLNNSGASNLLLGTNDVQQVSVVENGYTGQYGRQAGAQVDYTTRSGTNDFHGNAIYYWTGRALDANEWFLKASGQPRPFQNNNQWAASFGGPIDKNKAFFFLDTEGIRYIFGTASTVFLPTPAFQSFVLSQPAIAGSASNTAFYNKAFALYNATPGLANATPVSNGGGCTPGVLALGFSGDCLNTFTTSAASGNREWMLTGRVDLNVNESNKLFGQFRVDRGFQPTYADPINPAFNASSIQPQDDGQLNWTHIFSPTVVNNFIFSDLWYSALFQSTNQALGVSTFPEILCSADTTMSCLGPTGGQYPFGFLFPQGRNVEQWGLVDDFSWAHGSHNMKFGVNWRRDDLSDYDASELTLNPAITTSLAGFATDTVDFSSAQNFAVSGRQPLAIYSLGAYAQDQWQLKPSLSVTLTLRVDRNSPGVCQSNCAARTPDAFSALTHDLTIPYNQMVVTGLHQILPNIQSVVWEPRIGFAWSPGGKSWVLRGGAGLFSDLYPGFLLENLTTNFPQVTSWAIPGGTVNPAESGSGANLVAACNSAFLTNYAAGGNLPTYLGTAPTACTTSLTGYPSVPKLFSTQNNIKNPMYAEWNLEVEKAVGREGRFSVNYVGNHGYDGMLINPYVNGYCDPIVCSGPVAAGGAGFTASGLPATPPDQRVSAVEQLTNGAYSNYNGVTVSFEERFGNAFLGRLNYAYSHSLDVVSNGGLLPYSIADSITTMIDPLNSHAQYSSSDYDLRHQVSFDYVWTLPGPHNGLVGHVLGGWQVSGTLFWHTGFPFTMTDGATANTFAANNMLFNGLPVDTVLLQPSAALPRNFGRSCAEAFAVSGPACFSTADFAPSTTWIGGPAGRNFFRGPGYFDTDFSLRKSFKLTERFNFQIGANAFNVLNHVNFQTPDANNLSGAFGYITGAVSPPTTPYGAFASAAEDMRILQIVGKLTF